MALTTENVPREGELLCENCGYGLSGLGDQGQCPECGRPVAESTSSDGRVLPAWELAGRGITARLIGTTWQILTRPHRFYRHLRTRVDPDPSASFAFLHHWIAAYLFSIAFAVHTFLFFNLPVFRMGRGGVSTGRWDPGSIIFTALLGGTAITPFMFGAIAGVQWLAGKLTVFESRYHGLRLPSIAVRRAMHYHAAALFPVALGTLLIIGGYRALLMIQSFGQLSSQVAYLYTLCAWVIAAAVYLFWTYWAAMTAVKFANR